MGVNVCASLFKRKKILYSHKVFIIISKGEKRKKFFLKWFRYRTQQQKPQQAGSTVAKCMPLSVKTN